jgi:O-antigen biosynthesis protein
MGSFSVKRRASLGSGPSYKGQLPPHLRGKWCAFWTPTRSTEIVQLRIIAETGFARPTEKYLRSIRSAGIGVSLLYVPAGAQTVELTFYGAGTSKPTLDVHTIILGKAASALLLLASHPGQFISALRGTKSKLPSRLRAVLANLAIQPNAPSSYSAWIKFFDSWSAERAKALLPASDHAQYKRVLAIVFHNARTPESDLHATLQSIAASYIPVEVRAFDADRESLADVSANIPQHYVALIQAGEIVPAHAFALAAQFIAVLGNPPLLLADEDKLDDAGARQDPLFKPQPNHALMLSGTLSRGLWLIRRDVMTDLRPEAAAWAETVRLEIWLRLHESGVSRDTYRIPHILAHRRMNAQNAPPSALADVVAAHLARSGLSARTNADHFPLDVQILPTSFDKVSIVIPSAGRKQEVVKCLTGILTNNDWPDFEMILVISQWDDLEDQQRENLKGLYADPRVKILHYKTREFNYSAANNYAVAHATSRFICFVNDDVLPISSDWLAALMGHLSDPQVAAVGAKLLYENRTVQHAGVIMGLAGLCEHAFRHLPQGAPGYAGRACLDQELSAVTGACLLMRHDVFDAIGGMDEVFASGFNDVDLCMKIRAQGHSIVLSVHAELFHLESLSFGHHYAGDRALRELVDIERLWNRWHEICEGDPFHNPNLSLTPGNEWTPAFPPRDVRLPKHDAARGREPTGARIYGSVARVDGCVRVASLTAGSGGQDRES